MIIRGILCFKLYQTQNKFYLYYFINSFKTLFWSTRLQRFRDNAVEVLDFGALNFAVFDFYYVSTKNQGYEVIHY